GIPCPVQSTAAMMDFSFSKSTRIFYLPRDVVSGDFYWYNHVESKPVYSNIYPEKTEEKILVDFENEKSIIAAVDCTGHGIPGAFMSMIGDSLLNQIVLDKGITKADQILLEMHKGIRKALHQAESHNPDGMDMSICVIDKVEKVIEFAGARNPMLYFQNGEMHYIKGDPFSVGGWLTERENERVFSYHKVSYAEAPITFYIYSDGYRDQFGGPKNTKFLRRRFRELLQKIHNEPMTYQRSMLSKALREWMGDYRQMDDILIIGVRLD
ncbi:MAG: SpoIIE family protein phosphatase, partial [Bacteroidota bacterium]